MELLYGLTEQQMEEVFREVDKKYNQEDIEIVLNHSKYADIELTEEEMDNAIEEFIELVNENTDFFYYAEQALKSVLEDRKGKGK